ncbi:MAG: hypothetical protein ACYTAF_14625 [Planctomycetota bacterium]|jgi:hypothetical protein
MRAFRILLLGSVACAMLGCTPAQAARMVREFGKGIGDSFKGSGRSSSRSTPAPPPPRRSTPPPPRRTPDPPKTMIKSDRKKTKEVLDMERLRGVLVRNPTGDKPVLTIRAEASVVEYFRITETYGRRKRDGSGYYDTSTKTKDTKRRSSKYKPVEDVHLECALQGTEFKTKGYTDGKGLCSFDIGEWLRSRMAMPWEHQVVVASTKHLSCKVVVKISEKKMMEILTAAQ